MNENNEALADTPLILKAILEELKQISSLLVKQSDNNSVIYSLEEAARKLGLSKSHVYSLIYQQKIIPLQRKKKSKILFTDNEIIRYQSTKE